MSDIQIEVQGHKASVTSLRPTYGAGGERQFIVCVDFGQDHPQGGPISMGVYIPARGYTEKELIQRVTTAAEAALQKDRRNRKKEQEERLELERFERYTKKVAEKLGIGHRT